MELDLLPGAALVLDADPQARGQVGGLAQALRERVEVELRRLEDLRVGQERDARARALALGQGATLRELVLLGPADVVLAPDVAVAAHLDVQRLRQRVDDRCADAVQAAGDLVAAAVAELAAGVQDGQDDLDRGLVLLGHLGDGDAARRRR